MKTCIRCKLSKDLKYFHKNVASSDGKTNTCKDCKKELRKKYYTENKQKELSNSRAYQKYNYDKLKEHRQDNLIIFRRASSKWRKNNKEANRFKRSLERARKLKATPKWANLKRIKEIYENCPKGHHVDHIIPLKGKEICGLHIETNLQYLPAKENLKKGNKVI